MLSFLCSPPPLTDIVDPLEPACPSGIRPVILERRTSFGTGRDTVGHPPGCHDDLAVAAAGSVLLTTAKRPQAWVGTYGTGGRVEYLAKNNPHMQQPHARDTICVVQVKEADVEKEGIRLYK